MIFFVTSTGIEKNEVRSLIDDVTRIAPKIKFGTFRRKYKTPQMTIDNIANMKDLSKIICSVFFDMIIKIPPKIRMIARD